MTSNGNGAKDTTTLERAMARIPGVQAVRVVGGPEKVSEVHILADQSRNAKQVVRDVQSVALTTAGTEIDYRVVSVVQLEDRQDVPAPSAPLPHAIASAARPALESVTSAARDSAVEAKVTVIVGGEGSIGEASGSPSASGRLVAEATIAALRSAGPIPAVEVVSVSRINEGGREAVVVLMDVIVGSETRSIAGIAPVRSDHLVAIARATLDGLNRFI